MPQPHEILVDVIALSKKYCKQPIKAKLRFATAHNFMGTPISGYDIKENRSVCLLSRKAAEDLCRAQNLFNQQGWGLYLYDAYRPKPAVEHFWNWSQDSKVPTAIELERKNKHYPLIPKEEFFERKYIAKNSTHCYGNTLDTEIIDLQTQRPLFMGARISYMGDISHSIATKEIIKNEWQKLKEQNVFDDIKKQFKRATNEIWQDEKEEDYLELALKNRKILADVMQQFNFTPYPYEWWHYSHKDKESQEPMDMAITQDAQGLGVKHDLNLSYQRIRFRNKEHISFEYHPLMPKNKEKKINLTALQLYGMYRNTIYDSYKQKADLAQDIKVYKKQYTEPENSSFASSSLYQNSLYHYSVMAALNAMSTWKSPVEKMQSYIAYQEKDGKQNQVGLVQFTEMEVHGKPVVYIAQAGVANRGLGIGKGLMECVLSHYPAGTEFYICTRVFNTDAKVLYNQALGFSPLPQEEVALFGLDARYCGFKHTITQTEIDKIRNKVSHTASEDVTRASQNSFNIR
ncbi:MAG: M15 family metallopeptidase [Gammaproteobacteria bacterium]|nr:M15 family metallopeptidase [Gammaproteobacteria bacterium]